MEGPEQIYFVMYAYKSKDVRYIDQSEGGVKVCTTYRKVHGLRMHSENIEESFEKWWIELGNEFSNIMRIDVVRMVCIWCWKMWTWCGKINRDFEGKPVTYCGLEF